MKAKLMALALGVLAFAQSSTEAALYKWWAEFTYAPAPDRVGTLTPAHTITTKTGKVLSIPAHVQTATEFADQEKDYQFMAAKKASVAGFSVAGKTVTVRTTLASSDLRSGRELCQNLGAFVWANENRRFGLEIIRIISADGKVLAARDGLGPIR